LRFIHGEGITGIQWMMMRWWVLIHSGQLKSSLHQSEKPAKLSNIANRRLQKQKKQGQLACSTEKADTKSVHMQTSWPVRSGPAAKAFPQAGASK
jgi:hypothetical protein